ncbi:PLC-like phosphodiesterase [Venturia nashicola]|nr:PLC-like phosphodiesterase [Venturia nashicola]
MAPHIWTALLSTAAVSAQSVLTLTGTATSGGSAIGDLPTGILSYLSLSTTITLSSGISSTTTNSAAASSSSSSTGSSNGTTTSRTSTSPSVTYLGGVTASTRSGNATASSTSSAARPTNTQPCNGYAELCNRQYSNITNVAAHNYPFVKSGNTGSNQELGVTAQLNDGVRMLQAQTHYENNTFWYCHTSCNLLNVGTIESSFKTIASWLAANPYDVLTILLGNSDQVDVNLYRSPFENSGLARYAYTPPQIPMAVDDWPTLGQMILSQQRLVVFMDYKANQTAVPWILDEFSQMWETPFSPTDPAFPCTVQRPPKLNRNQSLERMYLANHNLNLQVSALGFSLLVPNTGVINTTNSDDTANASSLATMANTCQNDWGRPPNFLLVDYYNRGNIPGSVFHVAAAHNNVTYTQSCCGSSSRSAAISNTIINVGHFIASLFIVALAAFL